MSVAAASDPVAGLPLPVSDRIRALAASVSASAARLSASNPVASKSRRRAAEHLKIAAAILEGIES